MLQRRGPILGFVSKRGNGCLWWSEATPQIQRFWGLAGSTPGTEFGNRVLRQSVAGRDHLELALASARQSACVQRPEQAWRVAHHAFRFSQGARPWSSSYAPNQDQRASLLAGMHRCDCTSRGLLVVGVCLHERLADPAGALQRPTFLKCLSAGPPHGEIAPVLAAPKAKFSRPLRPQWG
jgi:hypothetical protein